MPASVDPAKTSISPLAERRPAERVVAAAFAGTLLTLVPLGWLLLQAALSDDSRCGHYGCVGLLADAWTAGSWAAIVVAWPLLHLFRVRPAWPVAVLAPFFLMPIWELADVPLNLIAGLFAYPAATLVSSLRLSWRGRGLVLTLFALFCALLALS